MLRLVPAGYYLRPDVISDLELHSEGCWVNVVRTLLAFQHSLVFLKDQKCEDECKTGTCAHQDVHVKDRLRAILIRAVQEALVLHINSRGVVVAIVWNIQRRNKRRKIDIAAMFVETVDLKVCFESARVKELSRALNHCLVVDRAWVIQTGTLGVVVISVTEKLTAHICRNYSVRVEALNAAATPSAVDVPSLVQLDVLLNAHGRTEI